VKNISLGTLVMAVVVFVASSLALFDIPTALAQDQSSLGLLKEENARLREELAALRERDRLRTEISTFRNRLDRKERYVRGTATSPETIRTAYASAPSPAYKDFRGRSIFDFCNSICQ
jgi:hypothetical protein